MDRSATYDEIERRLRELKGQVEWFESELIELTAAVRKLRADEDDD